MNDFEKSTSRVKIFRTCAETRNGKEEKGKGRPLIFFKSLGKSRPRSQGELHVRVVSIARPSLHSILQPSKALGHHHHHHHSLNWHQPNPEPASLSVGSTRRYLSSGVLGWGSTRQRRDNGAGLVHLLVDIVELPVHSFAFASQFFSSLPRRPFSRC